MDKRVIKENRNTSIPQNRGWQFAVELMQHYLQEPGKADELLAELPDGLDSHDRRRAQALFYGAIRWMRFHESVITQFVKKRPRPKLEALLFIACEELREAVEDETKGHRAQIVDHAINQTKRLIGKQEAGFVNAVLRRCGEAIFTANQNEALALSHPDWLVERWETHFGSENTQKLLAWNQQPPPVYFRKSRFAPSKVDEFLETTDWDGCFRLQVNSWPIARKHLESGALVAMDPAQAHPVKLLAPQVGESVLDLCAAPGGKSRAIMDALGKANANQSASTLVVIDLPGKRLKRLEEALQQHTKGLQAAGIAPPKLHILGTDALELTPDTLRAAKLPAQYDAILLDAPCSNTGVLRRRPDAKWRLTPEDITEVAQLQQALLHVALELLKPGGRIVYSTCSIEPEENKRLIDELLAMREDLQLKASIEHLPFTEGTDGAGAYLIKLA